MNSEYVQLNGDSTWVACPECGELLNGKRCGICHDRFVAGQDAECVENDSGRCLHYHKACYENAKNHEAKDRD